MLDFDSFPKDPAEQNTLVRFRVKKSVPFDVDSAAVAYHVQPRPGSKTLDVVVVVTALEIIARYEAPFRAAGLQPGLTPCGVGLITGSNLAPGVTDPLKAAAADDGTYPTTLGPVDSIGVGGVTAPVLSVSSAGGKDRITFQTPCETAPGPVKVVVAVRGVAAVVDAIPVVAYQPGLFEMTASDGKKYAMALRPDGSAVGPENPAIRGEVIRFVVTGLGQTDPPIVTGMAGVDGQAVMVNLVAGINDSGVGITNAWYATGLLGTYFVDLQLPPDTIAGAYQPVALAVQTASGDLMFGNTVYIPIQ